MTTSQLLARAAILACLVAGPCLVAQAPDNSAANKCHATTADNQSSANSDRLTTQKIRKALIADKEFSMYAHNVKIITANGTVTLKGPVKNEAEHQQVIKDASSVVPSGQITDQLTVKQ